MLIPIWKLGLDLEKPGEKGRRMLVSVRLLLEASYHYILKVIGFSRWNISWCCHVLWFNSLRLFSLEKQSSNKQKKIWFLVATSKKGEKCPITSQIIFVSATLQCNHFVHYFEAIFIIIIKMLYSPHIGLTWTSVRNF